VPEPLFHIALHEPEIPNNTGNIGRTCIATGCALHLIRPLGFDTDEKACRRAGLDYWPRLRPVEHDSWDEFVAGTGTAPQNLWLFTTRTARPVWDAPLARGDRLVFGKETRGLPESILKRYPDRLITLPMAAGERSLNLATAVCAAVYEGLRQLTADGRVRLDRHGRLPIHNESPASAPPPVP
jgi:tRNA (cytidine/uridine-2'-O-)-methyltransferase